MAGDQIVGLIAVSLCVVLFGIFTLPTKAFRTGDGVFFQFFMCAGIYSIGAVTHFVQCSSFGGAGNAGFPSAIVGSCPQFIPLSALGGAIWCTSNLLLVPIVNCIGVGLSMMVWGMAEMLVGWATGRFGWFGVNTEPVSDTWQNYGGVALAVVSLLVLAQTQSAVAEGTDKSHRRSIAGDDSTVSKKDSLDIDGGVSSAAAALLLAGTDPAESMQHYNDNDDDHGQPATDHSQRQLGQVVDVEQHWIDNGYDFTTRWSPARKKLFGICACIVAGAMSGSTFTAPQHVVDQQNDWIAAHGGGDAGWGGGMIGSPYPGAGDLFDQLYSHFTGIFLSSSLYTILYCIVARNKPWVSSPLMLPSFAAGIVWGLAMVSWFIANANLSIVIAFPMVTLGPGIVSMIIGTVVYREVHGTRNFVLLAAATAIYLVASVLIAMSGDG